MDAAQADGENFKQKYFKDAQQVLSRTNHHIHPMSSKGRQPLAACKPKGKRGLCNTCKGGYPKEKQINKHRVKVVCPGVAKKYDLRVSGRRNSSGSMLGVRHCPWLCEFVPALTSFLRCNNNAQPHWHLPIIPETHDQSCK